MGCYCDHAMKAHLAGVKRIKDRTPSLPTKRVFTLESFVYVKPWMIKHINEDWDFILDSGAFTFFKGGDTIDWIDYVKRYCQFIKAHKINKFFELDIETITNMATTEDLRKRIEDITGKQPIPVWRPLRGIDYWHQMVEKYPYTAISASGRYDSAWTRRPGGKTAINKLCRIAHDAGGRVHGLGYTVLKNLPTIGFDSVDSTAWIFGNMTGHIYRFNGTTMVKETMAGRLRGRQVAVYNFAEWVKYQRYAEKFARRGSGVAVRGVA